MKTKTTACSLTAAIMLLGSLVGGANAAVTITTSGNPANGTATLTIATPIQFIVSPTPATLLTHPYLGFTFQGAASPHDGSLTDVAASGLSFTINGGTPIPLSVWRDNMVAESGNLIRGDSLIFTPGSFTVSTGDVIVLSAGTFAMSTSTANFNLFPSGDYDIYMWGKSGNGLSGVGTAVPEPSSLALFGFGALSLLCMRSRR